MLITIPDNLDNFEVDLAILEETLVDEREEDYTSKEQYEQQAKKWTAFQSMLMELFDEIPTEGQKTAILLISSHIGYMTRMSMKPTKER